MKFSFIHTCERT